MQSYNIGIDLSLNGLHRASIFDVGKKQMLDKSFSFENTLQGFESLINQVEQRVGGKKVRLSFVMEPTSSTWLPISCYLVGHKYDVYRVSTIKSNDFRKFLDRYTKSDRIDARALSTMLEVDGLKIHKLYLPDRNIGTLSRLSKHMAKLIKEITIHKERIENIFEILNPGVLKAFNLDKFSKAARLFYRNLASPVDIVALGEKKLMVVFSKLARGKPNPTALQHIYAASVSITGIYQPLIEQGKMPFDFKSIQAEIRMELDIIECLEKLTKELQQKINDLYNVIDPDAILKSVCGIGDKIAPAILGIIGDVNRFPNIKSFKKYFGFIPKKRQSSSKDLQGLRINKAAQKLLKQYLYLAADTARRWDPEFAEFYHKLKNKGHHHYSAVCALANKLAGRVYAILKRVQQLYVLQNNNRKSDYSTESEKLKYEIRDFNGKAVSKKAARQIIVKKFLKAKGQDNSKEKRKESCQTKKPTNGNRRQQSQKENSSIRSGKTLRSKSIAAIPKNTTLSETSKDEKNDDPGKNKLRKALAKLQLAIEQKADEDSLCTNSGKIMKKSKKGVDRT